MLFSKKILLLCSVVVLFLSACTEENNNDSFGGFSDSKKEELLCENFSQETDISYLQNREFPQTEYENIETEYYINGDVKIAYPQFSGVKEVNINELIKKEATSIFFKSYYADEKDLILEISYAITLKNEKMFSVVFYGYGDRKGTVHPNRHFFAVTIDLENDKKICLRDVIKDFEELKNIIKNKNFVFRMYNDTETEELLKVNEFLVFENLIRSDEHHSEIYSYFTEESLGISFGVPHAIGDHKEIELPYNELNELLGF